MSHVSAGHASIFGSVVGLLSTALPEETMPYGWKILLAAPIALVSGLFYAAGAALWREHISRVLTVVWVRIVRRPAEPPLPRMRPKADSRPRFQHGNVPKDKEQ